VDPQAGQQPTADERSDDSNAHIGNETMSCAANDVAAKPPRDQTDNQNNEDTFTRHGNPSPTLRRLVLSGSMLADDAEDNLPLSQMPRGAPQISDGTALNSSSGV
jgi:hypothetical protein